MPLSKIEALIINKCGEYRIGIKFLILWLADMAFYSLTLPLALYIRFDFNPPANFVSLIFNRYFFVGMACFTLASFIMKTYSTIIRLANLNTALRISIATFVASACFYAISNYVLKFEALPRSIFLIQLLTFIPLAILCRFSFRLLERITKVFDSGVPTIIYGAGRTTNIFLPAMIKPQSGIKVIGLVDDDRNKRRGEVQGVPVLGSGDDLAVLVKKHRIQQVIICMPTIDGQVLRKLVSRLRDLSVVVKIAPEANSFINDNPVALKMSLRDLKIEDLLRRLPRKVDHIAVGQFIQGQQVLVTGGGGSIGSELCRQIVSMGPKTLIVNDASEYNLYAIVEELRESYPNTTIIPVLGDISHQGICERIFKSYKVELVFHAAAYKHVPLVEENIACAIRNNISGTYNLFKCAWEYHAKRVVLVSSDKAVNPTNAMGATKRACELIGLWFSQNDGSTKFSAVRFGNVLGSSGSVIPKFLRQIKEGGPVSITHPDITRYFMLIPEAVSLVLQASNSSGSGEIYVLDMGEPIKILDLAKDLLRIMGLKEGVDIDFVFTGLRNGEKMFEELYLGDEELERISDDFFKVLNIDRLDPSFFALLNSIMANVFARSSDENRKLLFSLIHPPERSTSLPSSSHGLAISHIGEIFKSESRI